MTGLNVALTGPEQTALAKPTTRKTYLSVVSNVVQATGVVAGITGFPTADVTMLSTSAGWSGITQGTTALITSNTGVMRGYYRVRGTGVLHLYIGEVGRGDPGLLAQSIRLDTIQGGDLVTVYNRWDIWAVMPRIVYTGGTSAQIFEDYDLTVGTENTYPDPIVQVTSNGKPDHSAGRVDAGQTYRTVVLVALGLPWPTSGSITYLWTTLLTVVGGNVNTNTVTIRVPAGATQQTVQLDVTESNGGHQTRYIHLWCYDFVTYFPFEITAVASDSRDRSYRKMTLSLYDNGLANIPDGSMVHVWDETTFGSTDGATLSVTDRFSGWLIHDQRQIENGLRSADVDIVGPGGCIASLNANSQYVTAVNGAVVDWQHVDYRVSNIDWITWWMVRRRTTLLTLFSYVPIGVTGSQGRMSAWDVPTGTVLQQCQTLALRYGCNFGTDSYGQICVRPIPNLYPYSSRGADIVTRDSVGIDDFMAINPARQYKAHVRRLRGEAFSWDGSSALPTPYLCDSPDNVPAQGDSEETMQSQIVESQDVLNRRNGNKLYNDNNPWPQVPTRFDYNRDVYEPAQMQFVHQNVPANYSPDGLVWDMNTCPLSVSKTYEDGGSSTIELQCEGETAAEFASVTVPVPPVIGLYGIGGVVLPTSLILPPVPGDILPPIDPAPTDPSSTNGSVQITGNSNKLFITQNYLSSVTTWTDITPSDLGSFQIKHAMFDLFSVATGQPGIYLLAYDGTNSAVWHTANAFRIPVPWSKGANISGLYTLLRLTQSAGSVEIYRPVASISQTVVVTFDAGGYPYTVNVNPHLPLASVVSGGNPGNRLSGGTTTFQNSCNPADGVASLASIEVTIPANSTVTLVSMDGLLTSAGFNQLNMNIRLLDAVGGTLASYGGTQTVTPGTWHNLSSSAISVAGVYSIHFDVNVCDGTFINLTAFMDNCSITYGSPTTGNAESSFSTDYGSTLSAPVTIGSGPGADGGFDIQHSGTVALAAKDQRVRIATTLGGSYSDEANGNTAGQEPILLLIPWGQFGATSLNNTGSQPHYLLGADVLVGSEALYAVVPAGQYAVTPVVSAVKAIPVGPNCASGWLGTKFTLLASVSGVVHLFTGNGTSAPNITWTDRGVIPSGKYTRGRYLSNTGNQIFFAADGALYYSPDFGVTIYTRPTPLSSGILFLENWG